MKKNKTAKAVGVKHGDANVIKQAVEEVARLIEEGIRYAVKEEHSPPNASGVLRSVNLITEVRHKLSEEHGWTSKNSRGASISISPEKEKALIIRSGNKYTGNPNASADQVSTNNRKISKTARAIHDGQSELALTGGTELQILLYRCDKDEMRIEISTINELDGETIKSLSNRECYTIDLGGRITKNERSTIGEQEPIVEEIEVKRKI
ncbi:hypothetical protein MMG00_01970 [Ignatzschineria rhizosphaerae]|uniref:Uncharacterized protein n=1 Tax=Ignatzschineria rhizosphaerae TaxID=2923279 RepID=A0ABY3X199_9GAMM|nr:hypothetical protein [Ignatzschineria rhizosphaerae]UNM96654.1 hypothetical protein MMG00_01970 [Ignatzschineria rhizosphaerae]